MVIDNLKAAVCKADRYEPIFQRTFEEYARYRGFVIDAAIAGHAQGKPHVERAVPYVRGNFFRGEQWLNLAHAQREAIAWCLSKAGTRKHGTTYKQPLVIYFQGGLVKTHPTQLPGGRDTDHGDYPEEKTPYTDARPQPPDLRRPPPRKRDRPLPGANYAPELSPGPSCARPRN